MTYLAKHYNLDLDYQTTMSWKSNRGGRTSVGMDICPPGRIRLYYTSTDKSTGRSSEHNYYVHIESTPCNYGGQRWWFRCPDCGRRCRVLYLPSDEIYFSCRICHNLTYESQQEGKGKLWPLFAAITKLPELEQKYYRTRSEKKRNRYYKKIMEIYHGMQPFTNPKKSRKKKDK